MTRLFRQKRSAICLDSESVSLFILGTIHTNGI